MKVYVVQRYEDDLNIFSDFHKAYQFLAAEPYVTTRFEKFWGKIEDGTAIFYDADAWRTQGREKSFETFVSNGIEEYEVQ